MSTVRPLPAPPKVLYLRREMAWRRYRRTRSYLATALCVFAVCVGALALAVVALGLTYAYFALVMLVYIASVL